MEKYLGILWQRDKYTEQFLLLFRYMGLLGALFVIVFGLLVRNGSFDSSFYNEQVFLALTPLFLALGIASFLVRSPTPIGAFTRIFLFHLLSIVYLVFVTGFQSPVAACWVLLMMAAYFYFSSRGLFVSAVLFALTAFIDFLVWGVSQPQLLLLNGIVASISILVGSAVVLTGQIQNREHSAFQMSRAQENLQRERILALVNSIGDAILNTDADGVVRVYNAASLNLFDTNESLNGKKFDTILKLYDQDGKRVKLFESIKGTRGVIIREDLTYEFADGEKVRLGINCSPVRESFTEEHSPQTGYIFIMRDITKAKSLEEERDEFISVVSHELRTPITIAEGTLSNAQFLLKRGDTAPEKIADSIEEAHGQVLFLAKMVNDLSTLSRAERGVADEPEEINVEDMVRALYHEYQPQAAAKKLHLDLEVGPKLGTVTASRLYLEEILQNFITNSIKYTTEGSVKLIAKRTQSGVYFAVKDTGIGISKTEQRKVFEKFYRSEDYRTRETGGTGLGLYVVSKLAQKLSIRVELQSRLNHGSTFSFVLHDPLAES
ncbi:MAG TPA: ATP-binding protein [Candidatus Saccharimonadales bacterium]